MARSKIIAELASSHGGDVDIAADMIRAAADAGADYAKLQTYSLAKLNPADPQYAKLKQAHLDKAAHEKLLTVGQQVGIQVFSTPFDSESLQLLRDLGLTTFKIASSESGNGWFEVKKTEHWFISWPWGRKPQVMEASYANLTHMTAIPLYPTPLECVMMARLLDGYSDHGEGLTACQWAIAHGIKALEVHLCLPGKSRVTQFDKTPQNIKELRDFCDKIATIRSGISTQFRERWSA